MARRRIVFVFCCAALLLASAPAACAPKKGKALPPPPPPPPPTGLQLVQAHIHAAWASVVKHARDLPLPSKAQLLGGLSSAAVKVKLLAACSSKLVLTTLRPLVGKLPAFPVTVPAPTSAQATLLACLLVSFIALKRASKATPAFKLLARAALVTAVCNAAFAPALLVAKALAVVALAGFEAAIANPLLALGLAALLNAGELLAGAPSKPLKGPVPKIIAEVAATTSEVTAPMPAARPAPAAVANTGYSPPTASRAPRQPSPSPVMSKAKIPGATR